MTLLLAFAFYAWLLYAVFSVPLMWLVAVMSQVAVAETVMGVYGYRRWRSQRQVPSTMQSATSMRLKKAMEASVFPPKLPVIRDPVQDFRTFLIGFNATIPIFLTIIFLVRMEFGSAVFTGVLSAALLPWAIRRIKRDLRS